MKRRLLKLFAIGFPALGWGQDVVHPADTASVNDLEEFVVQKKRMGTFNLGGAENSFLINRNELARAACCNLGESFTTNPSVDVNYSDPATGARQIKLLGLSGQYVQMLGENMPIYRGPARPYALRYVPGPWMKSISVSKGAASVRNGFESMSGQINVEYAKPDDTPGVELNAYLDSELKGEANAVGSVKINDWLSTEILAHCEDRFKNHDADGDTFIDTPDIRQLNIQNRWKYRKDRNITHWGIGYIDELTESGQLGHHATLTFNPYRVRLRTHRYDGYLKNARILDADRNSSLAVMANASYHTLNAFYGTSDYSVEHTNLYVQLMYESDYGERHNLSAGMSYIYDYLYQNYLGAGIPWYNEREETVGAYAQYTFKPSDRLIVMLGARIDFSTLYHTFFTPRLNVKWSPVENLNLKASAGKGYRTVFGLAEYNYLLGGGRRLVVDNLNQEASWTFGCNAEYTWRPGSQTFRLNAEYFRTDFQRQVIADYESDPHTVTVTNLHGKSYANTVQVDLTYESPFGLTATAAWRLNDVKTTYAGVLRETPLNSRYKGLLTVSYATAMNIWQFDATLQLNGGGRMPAPYRKPDGTWSWPERFGAFPQLNIQATRWFRHFSIYAGGENLTGFRQKNPVIGWQDPWGQDFDASMTWGPRHGAMAYIGIRLNFGKL